MVLKDIFQQYGYRELLHTKNAQEIGLYMEFLSEGETYPKELREVYISSTMDELFILLEFVEGDIQELCDYWDRKISGFTAFGSSEKEVLDKLKYNIMQIILCQDNIEKKELESSLTISRKIFIPCSIDNEDNIEINEENMTLLPFVLIEPAAYQPDKIIEKELNEYLPTDSKLEFLSHEIKRVNKVTKNDGSISKSLTDEQFNEIKGWLEDYDNTLG